MINSGKFIATYWKAKPDIFWEMDKETFLKLAHSKDSSGNYLCKFSDASKYKLCMGYQIRIVKEKCCRINYQFDDIQVVKDIDLGD